MSAPDSDCRLRVYMMDLLCMVPYYNASLCKSLGFERCRVELGSITYYLDPHLFRRQGLAEANRISNLASKIPAAHPMARRVVKLAEYILNLGILGVRFLLSAPDILHVQFLPLTERRLPFERWLLCLAKARGIRVVYTVHNVLPQDTGDWCRRAFRRVYELADALICHDDEAGRRLTSEFGILDDRIHIIPHGPLFDEEYAKSPATCRGELGFGPDECIVLCQGIIRPYKGIPFLLESWRKVHESLPRAALVIAGSADREQAAEVEGAMQRLGLEASVRLIFRFLSREELLRLYTAADILIYPYKEITSSGSLMTGISFRKPIIATALPAFRRVLDDQTGLLAEYGDTDELAAAIGRLVVDAELRKKLAARAASAAVIPWAEIAKQTYECYESVWPARRGAAVPMLAAADGRKN